MKHFQHPQQNTDRISTPNKARVSVNLATLLNSHKILPHYEQVQNLILTGGGEQYNFFTAYRG